MTKRVLWKGGKPIILISGRGCDCYVENGSWDLALDEEALTGTIKATGETVRFERVTDAPEGRDYNEILRRAEAGGGA